MRIRALVLTLCSVFALTAAYAGGGFQNDLVGQFAYVQKHILDLENAIPDSKLTWRPAKGVRSVSEVYAHIAFTNYMIAQIGGITLPDGISAPPADETKWEKTLTGKKELAEKLTSSFEFLKTAVAGLPDADLERSVDFFGQKMSVRSLLMVLLSHQHEHLGQSIAYARTNGIVPPWTAEQEAKARMK